MTPSAQLKAAEEKRKAALSEKLDKEARISSERIRRRMEDDRAALVKRYGGGSISLD
jgi:hypothetical protein